MAGIGRRERARVTLLNGQNIDLLPVMLFVASTDLPGAWKARGVARFGRFLSVGGACFGLNILVLWTATSVAHLHFLGAMALSAMVCNATSFSLNRAWTWKSCGAFWPELSRYFVVNGSAIAFSCAATTVLVNLGVSLLLANAGVSVVLMALNFVLHERWSFRN